MVRPEEDVGNHKHEHDRMPYFYLHDRHRIHRRLRYFILRILMTACWGLVMLVIFRIRLIHRLCIQQHCMAKAIY